MQTSVNSSMTVALTGQIADLNNFNSISLKNGTKKTDKITITAADLATTATINGTAVTVNVAAATLTKAALAALLSAAITAADLGVSVIAGGDGTLEYVTVEGETVGTTTTVVGTTNCSVAVVAPNADEIPFGVFVTRDAVYDDRCHAPTAAADITGVYKAAGIALRVAGTENSDSNTNTGYELLTALSVGTNGYFWVKKDAVALTTADTPYVRYVAGATETLGSFRNDADGSDAATLANCKFVQNAAASDPIVLIHINLP